jgi:1-acyl-sn-glycerol-3-phosphate acyltransferase
MSEAVSAGPKPRRLARTAPLRLRARLPGTARPGVLEEGPAGGGLRALLRFAAVIIVTVLAIPVQLVLSVLPRRLQAWGIRGFGHIQCWLVGMRLQVVGQPAGGATLYVSNHCSWLDIPVLMAQVDTRFVSKAELAHWPLFGLFARLGGTIFVSRKRAGTIDEAQAMAESLRAGHGLVLFPEGTTSDGTRVLPFRTSFFAAADHAARVQPVTIVYDRMGWLPTCRRDRPVFAWYGDMQPMTHLWRLLRRRGARATVVFHEAFDPALLPDRKHLAAEAARIIATSAAALRQNRPAVPLPAPGAAPMPAPQYAHMPDPGPAAGRHIFITQNLTDAIPTRKVGETHPNARFANA